MRLKNILTDACKVNMASSNAAWLSVIFYTFSLYSHDATVYHTFLWNMYTAHKGVADTVQLSFDQGTGNDGASPSFLKGAIASAFQAHQYNFVVQNRSFIDIQGAENSELQLMLARSLEHLGRHHEADAYFAKLEKKYPENAEVTYHCIRAYIRTQRFYEALSCAETSLEFHRNESSCAVFYYIQAQIYQIMNKPEEALRYLKKCIEASPRFDQGWFLWATLHEKMNQPLQVQRGYTQFLDIVGHDSVIEKKVSDLLIKNADESANWYTAASQAFSEKEYSKALLLVQLAEKKSKNHSACVILKLQILEALKRTSDLIAVLRIILLAEPDNEQWLSMFHALFLRSIYKQDLLRCIDEVVGKKSSHQLLLLYALDCALRIDDYVCIKKYYLRLLSLVRDDFLKARVLYQVGACAYERRDLSIVKSISHEVSKKRYPYAPLLNFAAYYFSKYEKAYDKAQVLITAAFSLSPENPHFKDTQAYIYLHTGKKEQALSLLQSLVYEAPLDIKIQHHRMKARRYE